MRERERVMMLLPEFLRSIQSLALLTQGVFLEDSVDKLAYGWTSAALLLITTLLSMRQYFFNSIACYLLMTETSGVNVVDYVENYCWLTQEGVHHTLGFVFGLMAILLYLPHVLWIMVCQHTAYAPLMELAERLDLKDAAAMCRFYAYSKFTAQRCWSFKLFPLLYLLHKILYICSSLAMILLLQHVVGFQSLAFGIYWESDKFPLQVLCPYFVQNLGNRQGNKYHGLCVLANNYLFAYAVQTLWYWFLILACLTLASAIAWLYYYWRKVWLVLNAFPPIAGARKGNLTRSYMFFLRVLRYNYGSAFLLAMLNNATDEEL